MLLDSNAQKIRTDMGPEFKSKIFKSMCSSISVKHFFSSNKAYLSERIIGIIKLKLTKLMQVNSDERWQIHLQSVVDSYKQKKQKRSLKGGRSE